MPTVAAPTAWARCRGPESLPTTMRQRDSRPANPPRLNCPLVSHAGADMAPSTPSTDRRSTSVPMIASSAPAQARASATRAKLSGGDQRLVGRRHDAQRLGQVTRGDGDTGRQRARQGADQRHHLTVAQDLRLVEVIGYPAIQGYGVGRLQAGRHASAEAPDERVGVTPAAVQLNGQVEVLRAHRGEELFYGALLALWSILGDTDSSHRRHDDDPIDRPGATRKEADLPIFGQ